MFRTVVAAVILFVLWLLVSPANAADSGYVAPRVPDTDHPDLNGIWQAMNEANWDVEMHMAKPALTVQPGPKGPVPAEAVLAFGAIGAVPPGVGVVEGGEIPYTPEGLATRDANRQNWLERDPEVKCYLPGVPRATYMPQPFQIFQNSGSVFIAYQYAGAVRDIYLEDPGPAQVDAWMGQSFGRWDGDTLVVEVTGLNGQAWLDRAGNHISWQAKVTERYTPMGPDHLHYQATIEDPETFTRPWTISMPLYRRMEANAQLMDFKCVEFVEELLYGQWRRQPLN